MTENKTMKQTKPLDVVDNLTEALKAVENVHKAAVKKQRDKRLRNMGGCAVIGSGIIVGMYMSQMELWLIYCAGYAGGLAMIWLSPWRD